MVEETVVPGNTHRQYGNECYDCRRGNEKGAEQMMVPQQAIRFKTLKITCICLNSCEVRSPIHNLSMQSREKRHLRLFTCLNSRVVHFEVTCGLDIDSFLNVFYIKMNRRCLPRRLYLTREQLLCEQIRSCKN